MIYGHLSLTIGQSGLLAKPNSFCNATLHCTCNLIDGLKNKLKSSNQLIKDSFGSFPVLEEKKVLSLEEFAKQECLSAPKMARS